MSSNSQTEGYLVFEIELQLRNVASSYNENLVFGFSCGLSLAADSAIEKPTWFISGSDQPSSSGGGRLMTARDEPKSKR